MSQQFKCPLLYGYQPVDVRKFSGGRPFVQGTDTPEMFYRENEYPDIQIDFNEQLVKLEDDSKSMILSVVKQQEQGSNMILRSYNISDNNLNFNMSL